jgi:di/tricarboxylate transporter
VADSTITLIALGVVVVLFVSNRFPVEVVAVGAALSLYATGVLTLPQALAGFGDPAVILIGALFVVSEGLDATGVTAWVGQIVVARAREGVRPLLLLVMIISAVLTAFIGLNGSVAALLPMVIVVALRRSVAPSQLLMPLAFAGSAGGLLLLTGSPVNVVISQAAFDAGVGRFGMLEFAIVGIPVVIGTIAIVLLFGERLVPERRDGTVPPDLSDLAHTLVEWYSLDNVFHLRVSAGSPLVGVPRSELGLVPSGNARVITVLDGATNRPESAGVVAVNDRLTVVGTTDVVERFAADRGLTVVRVRTAEEVEQDILSRDSGAAEVIIPPRSGFVGREAFPSQVLEGALIVLAIMRDGQDVGAGPVSLRPGDTVLVEGTWAALDAAAQNHDVLVVDSPELVRRQTVPLGRGSMPAISILVAMVVLLATGAVAPVVATLLAAMAMMVAKCVTPQQAYRGISWTTVLLVAGMIPMATAVTTSGAGQQVAERIVDLVGDRGPTVLLLALFVITVVFGQLISNTATALVMIPIAVSAADQLDISARPVLMSLCVGAAVAFLTPVATPANLMVMSPAGYRFGDYWKLGLPLVALFGVVSVLLVPLVWHF